MKFLHACCLILLLANVSTTAIAAEKKASPPSHTKKLSFNFKQIKTRTMLQLLAELADVNIIISDKVQGELSLHLRNVTWQHALNIILKSKGLAQRGFGNAVFITTNKEILAQEQNELRAEKSGQKIRPLKTLLLTIHYGDIKKYYDLLKNPQHSLLSARGHVLMLAYRHILIVEDTTKKLQQIKQLFAVLDKPIKQVMIVAKIVVMQRNFERNLGISWLIKSTPSGNRLSSFSMDLGSNMLANQGAQLAFGTIADDIVLDLELSALEVEGVANIVSSPRIMTMNNATASIEQGTQIPYSTTALNGGTGIRLIPATLKLEVTPQILPGNKMILTLFVKQDRPGVSLNHAQPPIDTRSIKTQISVHDGQTIVLGGIYERDNKNSVTRVPFLGSIPILGKLFSSKHITRTKTELMIFITPKIVKEEP
ncbi:MAG: type IV pilus secretin PilQ [Gammaproteobacteria bacterium]|nr:type IV pilus secretin PilQ [Gammaproteobacteria bacterium]